MATWKWTSPVHHGGFGGIFRWFSIFAVTLLVLLQLFDTNLHVAALLCTASIRLFADVINFSCKKIKYIPYLYNNKVPVVGHFFSAKLVTSTCFLAWNSAIKYFCDPLRLPVAPSTTYLTRKSTKTVHYACS